MTVKLYTIPNPTANLNEEYSKFGIWYNSSLPGYPNGSSYKTVEEFYNNFIEPRLPDTQSVIQWTELLLNYVEKDDSIFAIRAFYSWSSVKNNTGDHDSQLAIQNGKTIGKDNPYSLRRGFLTEFIGTKHKYFYSDNFFAAFFMKMAYDGFVPKYIDFITELKNRTFPARFGRSCSVERNKAAYSISSTKKYKDPGILKAGYKIAHVIDSGKNFVDKYDTLGLSDICNQYFPRGSYSDWVLVPNAMYYSRRANSISIKGLEYLKAHFLRFVCPIWRTSMLCSSAMVCHNQNGSLSSTRLPSSR